MNNDINNKIVHAAPVPPFVTFVASAVPMVFDNSMSYYEALCALWKWLQDDVIDVINNNATVTEQYIEYDLHTRELFIELKSYVDNYFDNLDVQEEINNKLDQMAEDGTLQEIITTYIQSNVAWTFDNVADMKLATNLVNGSFARTLGFYSVNDGGGALYKITNTGTANEMNVIAVGDSLYATLVDSGFVRPEQFGAHCDGSNDDTSSVQACLNYGDNITFPSATIMLENIEVPADKNLYFNKTILKRITTAEELKFIIVRDRVNFYGELEIDGQKISGDETANANLLRLEGDHCNFFGYIKAHDSLGHGLSMGSTHYDTFINVVEVYDNGRFRQGAETNGIGDGIAIINGYDVHVNKIVAYRNGRNGTSICSYGTPMKNIVVNEIDSGNNDYYDIDLEESNDVTVNYIRGYDTYYPNISLNHATNDKLENGEIRHIYGEQLSNIIIDNFTVIPDKNYPFSLSGSDIKLSNINVTDSRDSIGGYQLEITDTGINGYIKNVYIDHSYRGYNLSVKNLENIVVGAYTSDVGQINSRWAKPADEALQSTIVLKGGKRTEHVTVQPTATTASVGDIAILDNSGVTTGGTIGYYFNGSAWVAIKI